jgi:hypothetical protein
LGLLLLGLSRPALAADLTLEQVWDQISQASKEQQAARLEYQAASEAQARSSRHWLPRIYLDAKSYQTDDPGASFFGALAQRSVTSADFAPNSLNHPDAQLYSRGALGLDLPLYEGGMKVAQEAMQAHFAAAKGLEVSLTKLAQYSEVARAYGSLNALAEQTSKLEDLRAGLERVMKAYQLGNKSNPVGYSGLLGLKTVANSIKGQLAQNQASVQQIRKELAEMGLADGKRGYRQRGAGRGAEVASPGPRIKGRRKVPANGLLGGPAARDACRAPGLAALDDFADADFRANGKA